MSDRYLPERFQPAPGIPVETYSKWMKSGCTFDTDGFVYSKKGVKLAEWYKLVDIACSSAMPARLWSDLDEIETCLIEAEKIVLEHVEAIEVILRKYRKRLDEMKVASARFCVPQYKSDGEQVWTTVHISYDGYGMPTVVDSVDFEVRPELLHKIHTIGDEDIIELVNYNNQIFMDRVNYRSVITECVHDSYLQKLQPKLNDVITVKTNHFSFVFVGAENYSHGRAHNPAIWKVMAGPLPTDNFLTMDVSTGQIT